MEKDDFKKMDNRKKAEYINEILSEGKSFKDIYDITVHNNELTQSREALLNKFRNAGYRTNKEARNYQDFDKTPLTDESKTELPVSGITNNAQLEKLMQSAADIIQMLEWWKSSNNKPDRNYDRLNILLPGGDEIRKTIRIDHEVWEKWKEFCSQQPNYTEKDLLAKALLFYIEKPR